MTDRAIGEEQEKPLESWKAIATHLSRDVRTVMRWEQSEGLPVHRHRHFTRSSVYAFPSELDAWRANRRVEPLPSKPSMHTGPRLLRIAAVVAFVMATAADSARIGARQSGESDRMIDWPGGANQASTAVLSPNGRLVSYIDMSTRELHVRDLDSGRSRQLTNVTLDGGYVDESAISNDGRFIAFASEDKDGRDAGLRMLPLNSAVGATPTVLASGRWYAPRQWSRDDRLLLVTASGGRETDIGIVNVASRSLQVLTTIGFPGVGDHVALSPDARFVAYDVQARPDARERDVYLLPVAGGPAIPVATGSSSDSVIGWAPDGRDLIVRSDRARSQGIGLWALPVTDGRPLGEARLLRADFRDDVLSLTAQGALFYERTTRFNELMMTPVDLEHGRRLGPPELLAHDREAHSRRPRWSPDGQALLYETRRASGPVWTIRSILTGVVREIPLNFLYVWTFDWSPDGAWIVCRATDLQGRKGIHLVDAHTGNVRLVVEWTESPTLSDRYFVPQFHGGSAQLAYIRGGKDKISLYVERSIDTGAESTLGEAETVFPDDRGVRGGSLRRSPDGLTLLTARDDGRQTWLRTYNVRSKETRIILTVDRPNAINPEDGVQWLADGTAVVANIRGANQNQRELWWIPVDGRPAVKVDLGVDNLVDSAIAVNPKGNAIAFVAGRGVPSKSTVLDSEFHVLTGLMRR